MTRKIIVAGSATCGKTLMLEQRAELLKKQGKKVKIMRADDLNNKKKRHEGIENPRPPYLFVKENGIIEIVK